MECLRCKALTEAVDELSEMLSNAQKTRRRAFKELRELRNLLILDMEQEHDSLIGAITGKVGLPEA